MARKHDSDPSDRVANSNTVESKIVDRDIVDGLGLAVMAVDNGCRIIRFNGPAERLTGLKHHEVLGAPCSEVLKATLCHTDCPVRCALRTGTSCQNGMVVIEPQAEHPVTVSVTASALLGEQGEIVGAVGLLRRVDEASEGQVRLYGSRVFISRTQAMRRIFDALPKLATSPAPLLIAGGRGAGRSALAETIHGLSKRGAPLVSRRSGEHGLATSKATSGGWRLDDANADGAAQRARGGTLLLEDVCSATPSTQQRLLAWLDEGGDTAGGVRLITTATPSLNDRLADGSFRRDLYYRLNVLHVALPDLKDRAEDIPMLVQEFIEQLNHERGRQIRGVSVAALRQLMQRTFPENVRELRTMIDVAHARCRGPLVEPQDLPQVSRPLRNRRAQAERDEVIQALRSAGGSVTRAAATLGVHRTTLWRKIKRFGIERAGD